MTENEYTLTDALNYAEKMQNAKDYSVIDTVKFSKSLKQFADAGDKDNFKKLTDKYLELLNNSKDKSSGDIKKNPLSFLEFICAGLDNGFAKVGYSSLANKNIAPGNAQKLLIEVYNLKKGSGDCFGE